MESIEQRLERLEYYQKLMIDLVEKAKWPFHQLIMVRQLTEHEVNELFQLCENLTHEYKQQKAEGFISFSPLLHIFKQYLNPKLSCLEVIIAMEQEQLYLPLMNALKNAMMDEPKRM
ncbi:DUF1878 family protein [Bacillus suaedaesalsae]|uniref:DUF1878 family protein n=1 Tax=Bacillus suaedaesalsae TaxID=2810349 RepID=A0ABS2DFG0_9BACI|nr:DUF1878 family protein [Bacillus suaedaesalsae]MBM6617210.1 DUF1878 family protein [Bacillus suaedaesalsae]